MVVIVLTDEYPYRIYLSELIAIWKHKYKLSVTEHLTAD